MGETPDVGSFKDEVPAELPGDGKIEDVRIWSLELVVQAPVNGKRSGLGSARGGDRARKRSWRRPHHLLAAKVCVGRRQDVETREARRAVHSLGASRIHQCGGQAE